MFSLTGWTTYQTLPPFNRESWPNFKADRFAFKWKFKTFEPSQNMAHF